MPRVRVAAFTITIAVAAAGIWFAFAWRQPPTLAPAASIHLVGYTSFTVSNPDTNVFVFPGRGSWLRAEMVLTNEGDVSISYGAWGNEPYGWATVQIDQGTTNGYLAPPFTGGMALLSPGEAAKFCVILPPKSLQWQCGFDVHTASTRERAGWRVFQSNLYRRIPDSLLFLVRLLPDKTGPTLEVKSPSLEVPDPTGSSHKVLGRTDAGDLDL